MKINKTYEADFIGYLTNHQHILHKITLVYSGKGYDREDLYQEIVLQLWKSYPTFKGDAAFSTWMYRVALNTAITLTRRPRIIAGSERITEYPEFPDDASTLSEDLHTLYRAISMLNKIEKAIILLWLEERSYVEIADMIGITEKNVSVKLVRIRQKLGTIISKLQ